MALPRGATLVDFAYSVHTDVGNQCVAARINGELAPLSTELKHGDVVEVITDPQAKPSPAWLGFARTGKARSEIRYFLRRMKYGDSVALGRRLLEQSLASLRIDSSAVDAAKIEKVARDTAAKSVDDMLADIGLGLKLAPVVARSIALELSSPVPGGQILGPAATDPDPCGRRHLGPVRRLLPSAARRPDHRAHARRTRAVDPSRRMRQRPAPDAARCRALDRRRMGRQRHGACSARVVAVHVNNEMGLLGRVAGEISRHEANILQVAMDTDSEAHGVIKFTLQIRDRVHLSEIYRSLRHLQAVKAITRN